MLAELRKAAAGEGALDDARLRKIFGLLSNWEPSAADEEPAPGVPWSVPLGLLDAQIAQRDELADFGVFSAQIYGLRLDREGRRAEAIEHLAGAAERLAQNPYGVSLQIELGAIRRDEHELAPAMDELRAARDRIAALRKSGGGVPPRDSDYYLGMLDYLDARATAELGEAAEQLGMVDVAGPLLREARERAAKLDDPWGPATWGAAVVYALNLALDHRLDDGVLLRKLYDERRWDEEIPVETRQQIGLRLAMIDVQRAFLGELPAGSGEAGLRAAIEATDPPLKLDEGVTARLYLATSYLDGEEPESARACLDDAQAVLARLSGQEPARLLEAGLRARMLRMLPAPAEVRARFLEEVLRPTAEGWLELMRRWPLEDSGVAILGLDRVQAAFEQLIAYELELDAEHGPERALAWVVELQSAGTFARSVGIETPDLARIREHLLPPASPASPSLPDAAGAGLLAWVPGRETTHLFALTAETLAVHRLDGTMRLQQAANRLDGSLYSALLRPDADADEALAEDLDAASRAFLPDALGAWLDTLDTVRPVGLEAFGYVPLEALPAPRERDAGWGGAGAERWKRVLGCTHQIAYLPSLPVGVWLAGRTDAAAAAPGGAVVFVGRGAHSGYQPLTVEPRDVGLAAFGAGAVGTSAVSELEAALGGANLVHLFCHGDYDESRLRPAGLLVDPAAAQGTWFAEDVEARAWPPVVLVSACGAERAPLRRGDDGAGKLLASFLRGGALVVATATMPLEESAAAEFGWLVSAELGRGRSVGEAFLAARRSARPEALGVHPIHAHLWHVWAAGDLRVASGSPGTERDEASANGLVGSLALGTLLALGAALALGLRRRRSRAGA